MPLVLYLFPSASGLGVINFYETLYLVDRYLAFSCVQGSPHDVVGFCPLGWDDPTAVIGILIQLSSSQRF